MPYLSRTSTDRLMTTHVDLVTIFTVVVARFDCRVMSGQRGEAAQNNAYASGFSELKYPHSKHNKTPSMAVDVLPYPLDNTDIKRQYLFAGYVLGVAERLLAEGLISHKLRWGGDWDMDTVVTDQQFNDLGHFELIEV